MSGLLQLPRTWFVLAAMLVASIGGGVSVLALHADRGASTTNVLGEKLIGSGSSTSPSVIGGGNRNTGGNGHGNGSGNGGGNGGGGNPAPGHDFTISGTATGLFPGTITELHLTITNPNNQAITVTDLSASLSSVTGDADCTSSASSLTIESYTGAEFDVAENASETSPGYIALTLPSSVPNACQDATYNLTYSGTAVQK